MKSKHFLLFVALFLMPFFGCKKDAHFDQNIVAENLGTNAGPTSEFSLAENGDYCYTPKGLSQYPPYANVPWFIEHLQTSKERYENNNLPVVDPCD